MATKPPTSSSFFPSPTVFPRRPGRRPQRHASPALRRGDQEAQRQLVAGIGVVEEVATSAGPPGRAPLVN